MSLIQAALERDINQLQEILTENPKAFTTDINEDGQDALQCICAQQQIDEKIIDEYIKVIRILLDNANKKKLSINEVDLDGNGLTALMYAMENNHQRLVAVFLEDNYKSLIDGEIMAGGRTHLIVAARNNFQNVAKALLEQGIDIDTKDSGLKRTALHWAAYFGHKDFALLLLQNGANRDALDRDGLTPAKVANSNNKEATATAIATYQVTVQETKSNKPKR